MADHEEPTAVGRSEADAARVHAQKGAIQYLATLQLDMDVLPDLCGQRLLGACRSRHLASPVRASAYPQSAPRFTIPIVTTEAAGAVMRESESRVGQRCVVANPVMTASL